MTQQLQANPSPAAGGSSFGQRLKDLFHEGNVRHVVVSKDGRAYVDLPLTVIVIGALLAPWLAVIGVLVAVFVSAKMEVVRTGESPPEATPAGAPEGSEPPEASAPVE